MNRVGFSYEIFVELLFTADEVRSLLKCSAEHDDGHCRSVSKQDEFLWGMKNCFVGELAEEDLANGHQSPYKLSFREVDTLCKILEGPGANVELAWKLKQILKDINEEYQRIRRA